MNNKEKLKLATEKERQAYALLEEVRQLRREVAESVSPFKVGDIVEKAGDRKHERFEVVSILLVDDESYDLDIYVWKLNKDGKRNQAAMRRSLFLGLYDYNKVGEVEKATTQ